MPVAEKSREILKRGRIRTVFPVTESRLSLN